MNAIPRTTTHAGMSPGDQSDVQPFRLWVRRGDDHQYDIKVRVNMGRGVMNPWLYSELTVVACCACANMGEAVCVEVDGFTLGFRTAVSDVRVSRDLPRRLSGLDCRAVSDFVSESFDEFRVECLRQKFYQEAAQ